MGNVVVFAGGTGIFPFLDFLDWLLKKTLVTVLVKLKGNKILEMLDESLREIFYQNDDI
jgi:hypothetical protein